MELLVFLEGTVDRYTHGEEYETDPETGELLILPAEIHHSGVVITTYNSEKWISVRRVLEPGEQWPVVGESLRQEIEKIDPEDEETNIRHLVQRNPYADAEPDTSR